MSEFTEVASTKEIGDGTMKRVQEGGRDLLIARVGDQYYAAENRCPHMGGDLSQGTLEGTIVTCPSHHSQFDLTDGRVVRWTDWSGLKLSIAKAIRAPRPLSTYAVEVEGDSIRVRL
jgi:3-phenylpropionate/trans-cinnamate dioxygenase ferredoxin subunit